MKKYRILVCERYDSHALQFLQSQLDCEVILQQSKKLEPADFKDIDVVMIRSRTSINEHYLQAANKLSLIVSATSGFDHIDLDLCVKRKIKVMHTPNANIESAAQLTLLLTMSLKRSLSEALDVVQKCKWKDDLNLAHELGAETLGIIGLGRVGQRVAEIFKFFNFRVIAYDPYLEDSVFTKLNVERLGFNELLRQSDIVSLHTPLTAETKNMLNRKTIDMMTPTALLVNVARGPIVNEQDLFEALAEKKIAGAALDVFIQEPLPQDSNLRKIKNLIMTPHIGAFTNEAYSKASMSAAEKVVSFFKKGDIFDELPPKNKWYKNQIS